MSFQDLVDGFNADLLEEATSVRTVRTGTYVGQVLEVKEQANRFDETPELNVRVQLLSKDLEKVGTAFMTLTALEKRSKSGKLAQATKLFYQFAKVMNADSAEEVVEQLPNFVFSLYGSEYFNGKNGEFPAELQSATLEADKWQKLYVNADQDKVRNACLDAELRSRFEIQRVGAHRD